MPFYPARGSTNWNNLAEIYVGPDGNDGNDGNVARPFQHIYNAIAACMTLGGGTVYISEGCSVGGPVSGQGIRLRQDFMPNDGYFFSAAAGFLKITGPLRLCGIGGQRVGVPIFNTQPLVGFTGGGDSAKNPAIWIVGQTSMQTVLIENLKNAGSILWGTRIGVDYDRLTNGDIKDITVANATRTGETTVYTLTLANPITVTKASRTNNVTTLTIPNPGLPWPNVRRSTPIVFTSGDSDFASGAYVITSTNDFIETVQNAETWLVSYAETGADVPEKTIAASSYVTHNCQAGDLIDLDSDNVHFYPTQYRVDSVDANGLEITVTDVWGDGNANENDIGTISRQERYFCGTVNTQCTNVSMNPDTLDEQCGHGFDIGSSLAWRPALLNCAANGAGTGPLDPRDERRQASFYVYASPGSTTNAGSAIYMERCVASNAPVYLEVAPNSRGYGQLEIYGLCGETAFASTELPTIRVDGNAATSVFTDNVLGADSGSSTPVIQVSGCEPTAVHCTRSGLIQSACVGGDTWWTPTVWKSADGFPSPWIYDKVVAWADSRITGKHPGVARSNGVYGARFKNIIADPTTWTLRGSTRTTGQLAPDGSSTAVKIDSAGDFLSIYPSSTDGNTWQVGGKFVISGWVNATTANAFSELFRFQCNDITVDNATIDCPYTATGWQYVQAVMTVEAVADSTPAFEINVLMPNGKTVYFWGMTAFYVPTSVDDNDAFEMAHTMRQQPRYLAAGMSGTMEGGKLIAHGGMGVDTGITNVVGAGSGELTLTGTGTIYMPVYDSDGTTILGWTALLQATVNP